MSYGVTPNGFVIKPFNQILDELKDKARTELGDDINLLEESRLLRFLRVIAWREDDLWQLAEQLYYSAFFDTAESSSLDNVAALIGYKRLEAKKAAGTVTLDTPSKDTSIPGGTKLATKDESVEFKTTESLSNTRSRSDATEDSTGTSEILGAQFELGIESNEINNLFEVSFDAMVSDGTGEYRWTYEKADGSENTLIPSTTFDNSTNYVTMTDSISLVTDSQNVTIRCYIVHQGYASVNTVHGKNFACDFYFTCINSSIEAVEAGNEGNVTSNIITVMVDSVSGVDSVTNNNPTADGRDTESDIEYRDRIKTSIKAEGKATVTAIAQTVRNVEDVETADIEENDSDISDNGLPPKSFRVFAYGGKDDDIAQAIFNSKPVGIEDYGSSSGAAVDIDGNTYTIYFDRPAVVDIYIDAENIVTESEVTEEDIEDSIFEYFDGLSLGDNVIYNSIVSAIMKTTGVKDADVTAGTGDSPTGTSNILIADSKVALTDRVKITVTFA